GGWRAAGVAGGAGPRLPHPRAPARGPQFPPPPPRRGPSLDHEPPRSGLRVEQGTQGTDGGRTPLPPHHLAGRIQHGRLAKLTVDIHADKVAALHRGLHALGFLVCPWPTSLPNGPYGRPAFLHPHATRGVW